MTQVLDKRTADIRLYDIDCSRLLSPGEVVTSVTSIAVDQGGCTFGPGTISSVPITYTDPVTGTTRIVPAGQVIQTVVSGGVIPAGAQSVQCVVRALFATNLSAAVEATLPLRLINTLNVY